MNDENELFSSYWVSIDGEEISIGDQFTDGEGNILEVLGKYKHTSQPHDGKDCFVCYINWKFLKEDMDKYKLGKVFSWRGSAEVNDKNNVFLNVKDKKYFTYRVPKLKEKIDLV